MAASTSIAVNHTSFTRRLHSSVSRVSNIDGGARPTSLPNSDVALNKMEVEREFILTWKACPALWDCRNQYYTNKSKRLECLKKLLDVYKKIKPSATTDDVRKKINIFRSNYKRELNKIEESRKFSRGYELYSPRVWYFPLLNFLVETKRSIKLSQGPSAPCEAFRSNVFRDIPKLTNIAIKQESGTEYTNEDEKHIIKEDIFFKENICEMHEIPQRGKCELQDDTQNSIFESRSMQHTHKYNALAAIWSDKLDRLCPIQKLYAEKAINDVLFEAELGNLNKFSVQINSHTESKTLT